MCVFKTLVWGMVRDKTFPPVILVGCGRVGCPDNKPNSPAVENISPDKYGKR